MMDCLNELDDNERDLDKIADVSHKFLWASAIKNANKIIEECLEDGKIFLNDEQKKKKSIF